MEVLGLLRYVTAIWGNHIPFSRFFEKERIVVVALRPLVAHCTIYVILSNNHERRWPWPGFKPGHEVDVTKLPPQSSRLSHREFPSTATPPTFHLLLFPRSSMKYCITGRSLVQSSMPTLLSDCAPIMHLVLYSLYRCVYRNFSISSIVLSVGIRVYTNIDLLFNPLFHL